MKARLLRLTYESPLDFVTRALKDKDLSKLKGDSVEDLMQHQLFHDLRAEDLEALLATPQLGPEEPVPLAEHILEGDLI